MGRGTGADCLVTDVPVQDTEFAVELPGVGSFAGGQGEGPGKSLCALRLK